MPISAPFSHDAVLAQLERDVAGKPKSAPARYRLAVALLNVDDPAGAIEQGSAALALDPRLRDAARLLASLLQRYELNPEIDISIRGLEAAFAFHDVDRQALAVSAIRLLKEQAPLARILATGRAEGWDAAARLLQRKDGRALLTSRLFRLALIHGVNTDIDIECLLTAFRRDLLLSPDGDRFRERRLFEFACALVQQCLNNEYVFFVAADERDRLNQLTISADSVAAAGDLLLACLYQPCHALLPADMDASRLRRIAPRALREVLQPCLAERNALAERSQAMPRLTVIADDTSRRVEQQYISDPYPRWLSLQTPQSAIARAALGEYFAPDDLAFMDAPFNVLIAGCGTGQQAVSAALGYGPDADVLAVDLSTSSLAYAAQMAERYDAGNLRFAQADILGLDTLDTTFDIIECVGVLHHMADPYDAWRILIDRLRPGGLMLTGLYSAVSRANFAALWDDADWPGADADDDALRHFRRILMQREAGRPGTELLVSKDFFAKSGFRDLALHVSEQHCSLPDIKAFLDANGLVFGGFHLPAHLSDGFRQAYPEDGWPGSLEHWAASEQAHPRPFDGMYNFWSRKR